MGDQFSLKHHQKKVCIIIPVYNAEKYLGYCLNSILSQTYTNWNAILIDDGSTDGSLEICHNYEAMDARFHVHSKKNGGVSSARNLGLHFADGDYLEFVDSDDCLAPDALEKQVFLAMENNSQLVVMNALIVDFQNPGNDHIMLNSSWLGQSPYALSAEEFKKKRMRLIWHTALLESPWAKLYDLSLWKSLDIHFVENMSYGEDFMANMIYYNACNKAVFLNECGYYYNQSDGSGSLSERYRSDIFELKMYLMDNLEKHLGGRDKLSDPERDAFDCYAASGGLAAVKQVVLNSDLDEKCKIECLCEIFAHPLFKEALQNAKYIPEQFVSCVQPGLDGQYEKVIALITQKIDDENKNCPVDEENQGRAKNRQSSPSLLNRMIRKGMRLIARISTDEAMSERLTRVEQEAAKYGLKYTLRQHSRANQRVTRANFEDVCNRMNGEIASKLDSISNQVEENSCLLNQRVDESSSEVAAKITKGLNDHTWMMEQHLIRYSYLQDINELRQKKKAVMLATAEHTNIGDAAITLAEQQLLGKLFPEYFQVEISTYEFNQKEEYLHAILNPEDILFIHGGGNIGDLYKQEEMLHRKIVSEFPNNKIIILPQTICFSDSELGQMEQEKSARIYSRHRDLTLLVRGKTSLDFARSHFSKVRTMLMPDMVHVLRTTYEFDRSGSLLCLRNDVEGTLNDEQRLKIEEIAAKIVGSVDHRTNVHTEDVSRDIRGMVVRSELMRYSRHQVVITDRLHGMIFSAITGTPCVVLSSYNHKIREYYEAFFSDSNAVFFIGDELEKLETAIKSTMQVEKKVYPVFDRDDLSSIREAVGVTNSGQCIR